MDTYGGSAAARLWSHTVPGRLRKPIVLLRLTSSRPTSCPITILGDKSTQLVTFSSPLESDLLNLRLKCDASSYVLRLSPSPISAHEATLSGRLRLTLMPVISMSYGISVRRDIHRHRPAGTATALRWDRTMRCRPILRRTALGLTVLARGASNA